MVGAVFVTSGSPYPANPTPAPRVVHEITPHFLSPPQNRLLHGTAAFVLLPFTSTYSSIAAHLPHQRPHTPHWSRSTVVAVHGALPRHRLPWSRICFSEVDAKRRSTTVMDNELTPIADHDSQRLPRPSFSSSVRTVCIESVSSTCAVPILFIPTLQISWVLLFP